MKHISVVIPAYNEEKYLVDCLQSLQEQTFPKQNFEVIVVDNNSTDRTREIALGYGARIEDEKTQGYVFSLNTGMNTATAEIIAVTDADTKPKPDWLEAIMKAFTDSNVAAVTGPVHIDVKSKLADFFASNLYKIFVLFNFAIGKPHLTGFNFAVDRKSFLKINGIDINFKMSPDVDLGLRLKEIGKVVFSNNIIVINSPRRWKNDAPKILWEYLRAYFYTVWLRKPPPVNQEVFR